MESSFNAVKIAENVYWVGAIDWSIREFHGYSTNKGTTYNAFLIIADKITLVDTVKSNFRDEMLGRISSVVDPGDISYIISNHSEMDHSGCLPHMIKEIKPEKVFASIMGKKALHEHFGIGDAITSVKDQERLSLGNMELEFHATRMLHWPDSMMTFLKEPAVLFSQDAFGMHVASSERFDDEMSGEVTAQESAKYFANILLPYSTQMQKLLQRFKENGPRADIVAPDHGPVWRTHQDTIVKNYVKWANNERVKKVVIVYDTMWGSTDLMARSIGEGVSSTGVEIKFFRMGNAHRSDVATEILDAGGLVVGSPTLNNNVYPTVVDTLSYIRGLRPKGLRGFSFGSYGWGGESVRLIEDVLRDMKVEITGERLKSKYVPGEEILAECFKQGKILGEML